MTTKTAARRTFLRAAALAGSGAALTACGAAAGRPAKVAGELRIAVGGTSPEQRLAELRRRLMEIYDLDAAAALLSWDQETYMPPGGAASRGRQLAMLVTMRSQKFADPEIGRLLDGLQSYADRLPGDSDDARLIRVTRREYEREVKVPPQFTGEFQAHASACFEAWARARPADDFGLARPWLEKTLDYSRRLADFYPGYQHIADPLIDMADPGMQASSVRAVFDDLRRQLVPMVEAITAQPPADDACLRQHFPKDQQLAFGRDVIRQFGFDFDRGREDLSAHPFTTRFSPSDVRITTRVDEDFFGEALFGTLHESGHAMYEQGIDPSCEGTPLAGGASSGVHESQSRLWENIVGRGRPFWQHAYPRLQAAFPRQLGAVALDTFYRAINKVRRSVIRTAADEVTYNLHIVIRFDLELEMLEGKLAVKDLPEAWRARQVYTLGNIMSAQFYQAALMANPDVAAHIAQGRFGTLRAWLAENIHRHGAKFTPDELLRRVTGGPLDAGPYIRYLRGKYGELYQLG